MINIGFRVIIYLHISKQLNRLTYNYKKKTKKKNLRYNQINRQSRV